MEMLVESNPVGVFKAMKEAQTLDNQYHLPFIPCKQKSTADYKMEEGATKTHVAKYIKRDELERAHH